MGLSKGECFYRVLKANLCPGVTETRTKTAEGIDWNGLDKGCGK